MPNWFLVGRRSNRLRGRKHSSRVDARDYGYLYWFENHWYPTKSNFWDIQHVQTGFYGLAIDVAAMNIQRLGMIDSLTSANEAPTQRTRAS